MAKAGWSLHKFLLLVSISRICLTLVFVDSVAEWLVVLMNSRGSFVRFLHLPLGVRSATHELNSFVVLLLLNLQLVILVVEIDHLTLVRLLIDFCLSLTFLRVLIHLVGLPQFTLYELSLSLL
jgi:hypothetical protein